MADAPIKLPTLAPAEVEIENLDGGGMVLRSPQKLGAYANSVLDYLHRWAAEKPDGIYLADRLDPADAWTTLTYGDALTKVRSLAQSFVDRGLSTENPVMIISDNSIENGLIQLAAMYAGVPAVPVSPAYSLMSEDFGKLKYIAELVTPGLVFAEDGGPFGKALA
ncbi:MAG: AMP-binding protein, partial [Proteobacteria bacterium]|nr:AMP-binding protein [Pseudomonadota bacterium]